MQAGPGARDLGRAGSRREGCDRSGAGRSQVEPREGIVPPLPYPAPYEGSAVLQPLRPGDCSTRAGCLARAFPPERGLLHSESPATSPFQPDRRRSRLRAHLRPPQALSGRSSAGPGKARRGCPRQRRPLERRSLALEGRLPGPRLLPRPWKSEEKGRKAGSREDPWNSRTNPSPGGSLRPLPRRREPQRRQRLGRRRGPSCPQTGAALRLSCSPDGWGYPSRTACPRARAARVPARCEREQAPPAAPQPLPSAQQPPPGPARLWHLRESPR